MASPAQLSANLVNAQLCTGPKTDAGKAASSQNSLRHGLTSTRLILPGEDPAEFDQLQRQLLDEHAPINATETMLVVEIAQTWWRLQRARRVETDLLEEMLTSPNGDSAKLDRLTRYMTTIERAWHKAIDQLTKLQSGRKKIDQRERFTAAREELATADREIRDYVFAPIPSSTSSEIGFVSQRPRGSR